MSELFKPPSRIAADKFFRWLDESRTSQKQAASLLGIQPQGVSNWRSRGIPPGKHAAVAALMGVSVEALTDNGGNIIPVRAGGHLVPLISFVQAGRPTPVPPDMNHDDFLNTDMEVPEDAFGLEIRGDSMEPEFHEGDRVIINPQIAPHPGDFVVAAVDGYEETTFKKYRLRGIDENGNDIIELVPLNEDYAPISSLQVPIRIIGVMVEHRQYRRR